MLESRFSDVRMTTCHLAAARLRISKSRAVEVAVRFRMVGAMRFDIW
jgi:hypothetical protein